MPRFKRQTSSKIPFTPSDRATKNSRKNDSISLSKGVSANIRSGVRASLDLKRSQQSSEPPNVVSRPFEKMKTADPKSSRSAIMALTPRSHLKSPRPVGGHLPSFRMSPASKSRIKSDVASGIDSMHKNQDSSRFLSISGNREKLAGSKAFEICRQGLPWHSKETSRLSFARRLQLFRALSKEPLSFLDLHVRFGVSKHTIRRLVGNGFLVEVWGANDVGVLYKLAKDSKSHLKEMEAAAKYDSKIAEKRLIRLKNRI